MPQTSDEMRALMQKWFGEAIDDTWPLYFLLSRGWTEKGGMLFPPTSAHTCSDYEYACLLYLREEWDYDWRDRGSFAKFVKKELEK